MVELKSIKISGSEGRSHDRASVSACHVEKVMCMAIPRIPSLLTSSTLAWCVGH